MITEYFNPKIFDAGENLTKKWFVYYYEPMYLNKLPKRVKVYGGINRKGTVKGRLLLANEICERIRLQKPVIYGNKKLIEKKVDSVLLSSIELMKGYSKVKTVSTYTRMAQRFLNFISPSLDKQATKEHALAFIKYLFDKKLSPKTVKAYQSNLKTLYAKYINYFEPENFKKPFSEYATDKSISRSLMYFHDLQIQRIKEYCLKENPILWKACLLQYYCFIRPNELRQLKAENINLNAGYIEVPGSISKNRKTQKVIIPTPLINELIYLIDYDPESYCFSDNGKEFKRDALSKQHKQVLKALNIKGHYGFYSWKHTGVVKAWKSGIDLKDLQMQLRHHSLDMVNEYLKNLGVMDCDRIRNKFPEI